MKTRLSLKSIAPYALALGILIGSLFVYFAPQLSGETIAGGDVVSSTAWSKQFLDVYKETGEKSKWNPSMFSGMPWGLLTAGHEYNVVAQLDKVLRLGVQPPLGISIKAGLLCFISLLLLRAGPWISLFGALAFAFNTNYLVLLEAGHQSKLNVLANFPLLIAGLILCFRGKWRVGAPSIALATSIAISNNHIQMVYYLLLAFVVFGLVYLIDAIREGDLPKFVKMTAIALGAALLGAGTNYSLLTSAKDFSNDTMRGKPILEKSVVTDQTASSSTEDGLAWDYAMGWSHGSTDLLATLIPRAAGGSSYEEVKGDTKAGRLLRSNNAKRGSDQTYQAPMYWGNMVFTSGPPYLSIVLFAICLLGMLMGSRTLKIAFGSVALFIILLSLGKNAAWLNKPLFDLLPLFDKFRAPSSAINVLIPFMAIFAGVTLKEFFNQRREDISLKRILIGLGGLMAVLGIFALAGASLFSFEAAGDARYPAGVKDIFVETRKGLFAADAWRSFLFVGAVVAMLYLYLKNIIKSKAVVIGVLCALVFIDLFTVGRRHLDADNWESAKQYSANFAPSAVDQQIFNLEKKGRGYYRVFDVAGFTSAKTSYHHNTIGGYHAAKLQRYQDLIDYHLSKGNQQVVNMLNGKYYITQDQKLSINQNALGNAWAVDNIQYVNTPNEEIEALTNLNTQTTAVINQGDFPNRINVENVTTGSCNVELTDYRLNHLTYQSNCTAPKLVVFSEVWYDQKKGMTAKIDGKVVDFVRANYVLRALEVPAGQHTIEFEFKPQAKGAAISMVSSILILGMLLISVLGYFKVLPEKYNMWSEE